MPGPGSNNSDDNLTSQSWVAIGTATYFAGTKAAINATAHMVHNGVRPPLFTLLRNPGTLRGAPPHVKAAIAASTAVPFAIRKFTQKGINQAGDLPSTKDASKHLFSTYMQTPIEQIQSWFKG